LASISGGAAGGVAAVAMDGRPRKKQSSAVLSNLAIIDDNACMGRGLSGKEAVS
jgi:hypothetical protein